MSDADFAEAMYDEIYGLNCTIGQLTVENAKLREQLEGIVGRSFRTADKMSCLDGENAKLRELVRSYHSAMCCMLDTGIWPTDPKWLEHRMCELRVEVDE